MSKKRVLFLNVNGSGLGHLNRCLAYARRLQGRMYSVFFSLASAIDIIEEMGFEADYFVSPYWSANTTFAWNCELAVRFGLMLERVQPDVVVFDGTWPFQGFMRACEAYGAPALVWSNRGLLKSNISPVSVDETLFDLIIQPGELSDQNCESELAGGGGRMTVPPVCLLDEEEILNRNVAREELGLSLQGRYVLFSLGPGNLKDITDIGRNLIGLFESYGWRIVWTKPPITVRDVEFPSNIMPLTLYPLAKYMRAFDAFVGAAGYNTCCEVVQAQVPSLLVPNTELADDQARRAHMVARMAPVVVSACETQVECREAIDMLFERIAAGNERMMPSPPLNGASIVANALFDLASLRETVQK